MERRQRRQRPLSVCSVVLFTAAENFLNDQLNKLDRIRRSTVGPGPAGERAGVDAAVEDVNQSGFKFNPE